MPPCRQPPSGEHQVRVMQPLYPCTTTSDRHPEVPPCLRVPRRADGQAVATSRPCILRGRLRRRLRMTGRGLAVLAVAALAAGCSSLERMRLIGEQPPLSKIDNPTAQPGYKPVQMPMPAPQPAVYNPNSLWRNGSRAFFKDQRAMQVGDILTVQVKIADNATIANETQRSRQSKEDSGITDFAGAKLLTGAAAQVLPGRLLTADGTASTDNKGSVN